MPTPEITVRIQDFRAIKDAALKLNGLTVLSGLNGSGKSTIAKTLYYAIKTALNYETILDNLVRGKIARRVEIFALFADDFLRSMARQKLAPVNAVNIGALLRISEKKEEEVLGIVENFLTTFEDLASKSDAESDPRQRETLRGLLARANQVLISQKTNPPENFSQGEINEKVMSEFKEQFAQNKEQKKRRSLQNFVELCAREFDVRIPEKFSYQESGIEIFDRSEDRVRPVQEIDEAIYIDTPWIVDFLNGKDVFPVPHTHWSDILEKIRMPDVDGAHDFFSEAIADTTQGYTSLKEDDSRLLFDRKDDRHFPLHSVATGIKGLSIIQRLAEKHAFDEKTLLILDEPESHLHPQWIVEYARILVLMQKKLGVKMLIASHSPDMIDALQTFSESEGIAERTNFYLAEESAENSFAYSYTLLGNSIAEIFKAFNVAATRIADYAKKTCENAD